MEALFQDSCLFVTGVNYWASHAATEMWSKWDEAVVDRDFAALAAHGCQVVRVFPLWPDFQPLTRLCDTCCNLVEYRLGEEELPDTEAGRAGVSETMMTRFERFADLAAQHGIKMVVALLTGHMTARLFMPPALSGMNPISAPEALVWELRFVKYFVGRMKSHPAVAAWDYGNECNCIKTASAAEASLWMAAVADAIRVADTGHPLVSGMDGTAIAGDIWTVQSQAEHCDILTTHHYTMWRSSQTDPFDSVKATQFPVAQNKIYADVSGKPCFMEEIGSWRPMTGDLDVHAAYLRNVYWNLWANDGGGLLWWCGFDQDQQRSAPYDWDFAGLEHGMFGTDHAVRPTGLEMRRFRELLDSLPFQRLPATPKDAVCILGDNRQRHLDVGVAAFILAKQAGFELEFQHARQPLKDSSLYLLPSACGKAGMSGKTWQELRERVEAGATLYLSMDDTYLDHFAEFFGAETHVRFAATSPASYELNLEGGKIHLELPTKTVHDMRPRGAEVLGHDAAGRPACFSTTYGDGKVYLLSFPLESLMMERPGAFLSPGSADAWKLYAFLGKGLPRRRILTKNHPFLSVTEHPLSEQETACVVVNNDTQDITDELAVADGWSLRRSFPEGVEAKDGRLRVQIKANSGLVLLLGRRA